MPSNLERRLLSTYSADFNPNYKADQEYALQRLLIRPHDEFHSKLRTYATQLEPNTEVVETKPSSMFRARRAGNGIISLSITREVPEYIPTEHQIIERIRRRLSNKLMDAYYIYDPSTGLATDILSLAKVSLTDQAGNPYFSHSTVIELSNFFSDKLSAFANDGRKGIVLLTPLHRKRGLGAELQKEFGSQGVDIASWYIPLHELGHRFQYTPYVSPDANTSELMRKSIVISKFPLLRHVFAHEVGELKAFLKQALFKERNAAAFALGAMRKMNQSGITLFKDIPADEVSAVVHSFLDTYEKALDVFER